MMCRPILFLSGRADEIVPPYMMTALYRAAARSAGRCGASCCAVFYVYHAYQRSRRLKARN